MASSSLVMDEALVRAFEPSTFTKLLAEIVQHKKKETPSAPPPAKKQRTDGGAASTSDADLVVTGVVDADEAAAAKIKAAEARGDVVNLVMTEDMENRSREATEKACNYLRYCEPMVPGGGADETHGQRAIDVNQLDAILLYIAPAFVKPDDVAHIKKLADSLAPDAEVPVRAVHALLPSPAAATPVVVKKENGDKKGKCKAPNDAMAAARPYSASLCPASCDDSVSACDMSVSSRVALRALAIVAYDHKQALTPVDGGNNMGPNPKEVEFAWSVDNLAAIIKDTAKEHVDIDHPESVIAHGLHWKLSLQYRRRGENVLVCAYPNEARIDDNSCVVVRAKEVQLSAFDVADNVIEHAKHTYPTDAKVHLYHRSDNGKLFGGILGSSLKKIEKATRVKAKLKLMILATSPSIQNIMRA